MRVRVLFAAVALLAAACGSTAPRNALGGGATSDDGLSATTTPTVPGGSAATPTGQGGGGPSSALAAPGSDSEGTGAPGLAGTEPLSIPTASVPPPGATGPGVTAKTITLGVQYVDDAGELGAALGLGGNVSSLGAVPVAVQAMANDINAHGGIAGRKIALIFRGDPLVAPSYASIAQATCDFFTQDNKVFAVLSVVNLMGPLATCLAARHVPMIYQFDEEYDQVDTAPIAPYFYEGAQLGLSRWGIWIDRLADEGYFSGWDPSAGTAAAGKPVKVGVISFDSPDLLRVLDGQLEPRLAAHGLKVADTFLMATLHGFQDASAAATEMTGAVLKFKTEGITHVLFYGTGGAGELFFGDEANSQGYFPRWGLNTAESLAGIEEPDVPAKELRGSVAMGWYPSEDVDAARDPNTNPAAQRCEQILGKAGITPTRQFLLLLYCDDLFFLQTALDSASSITALGLDAAVGALGSRYQSAMSLTGASYFAPGRHDGASVGRDVVFDASCDCFTYTGPDYPLP